MLTGAQDIHEELLRVAKTSGYVNYSDVAPLAGLNMELAHDRNQIARILDGISQSEHDAGRPLLSAVVVRKDENMPGNGFFTLAKRLGLHTEGDNLDFWLAELRRVHDYWAWDASSVSAELRHT